MKVFEAPELKFILLNNDVITTSLEQGEMEPEPIVPGT